jgi:hypothetical protein
MVIRIVQGASLGVFLSLVIGLSLGAVGFTEGILPILILQLCTYLPAGYLAGKHEEHPYLAAGLSGACLAILNLLFSAAVVGQGLFSYIPVMVIGFTFGLILSLIGGLLSSTVRRMKGA